MEALSKHDFLQVLTDPNERSTFITRARFLRVVHKPTGLKAELQLGSLPLEQEIVDRSIVHTAHGIQVRLPTPEDMVISKAIAHRDQDMVDIRTNAEVYPNTDKERIQYWVTEYEDLLDEPELWTRVEKLINVY